MKMMRSDYLQLKKNIQQAIAEKGYDLQAIKKNYEEKGRTFKRFYWDLAHASHINFINYYGYLNDNHLDTALKKIANELLHQT